MRPDLPVHERRVGVPGARRLPAARVPNRSLAARGPALRPVPWTDLRSMLRGLDLYLRAPARGSRPVEVRQDPMLNAQVGARGLHYSATKASHTDGAEESPSSQPMKRKSPVE